MNKGHSIYRFSFYLSSKNLEKYAERHEVFVYSEGCAERNSLLCRKIFCYRYVLTGPTLLPH